VLFRSDVIAEEILVRHRESVQLIEARTGGDGRVRLLVVLDLDAVSLAAEVKRHEGSREAGPTVEVIDKSTWETMQRLAASGMVSLGEGQSRVLHQSPDIAAAAPGVDPGADQRARAAELRLEADRALRLARVLVAGGFAEEALPMMAKAIGIGAAAKLASRGELGAGAAIATSAQIRGLIERGALSPQAEEALATLWSVAGGRNTADAALLIEMTTTVLAGLDGDGAKQAA
jgi:hypothetical protein